MYCIYFLVTRLKSLVLLDTYMVYLISCVTKIPWSSSKNLMKILCNEKSNSLLTKISFSADVGEPVLTGGRPPSVTDGNCGGPLAVSFCL